MIMMKLQIFPAVLLVLLAIAAFPVAVHAYPTAAGSCPANVAAVGSPHITGGRPETTGSLADGGLTLFLNGAPMGAKANNFRVGELNELELVGDATPFTGFLIRVGPPVGADNAFDLRDAIYPVSTNDTDTQIAETTCVATENVGGLTHTNKEEKTSIVGTLLVEEVIEGLSFDVTVVMSNIVTDSTFYYSNFVLNAVQAVDPNTPVAAIPTTPFPTVTESMAPSMTPNGTVAVGDGTAESEAELDETMDSDMGGDMGDEEGDNMETEPETDETAGEMPTTTTTPSVESAAASASFFYWTSLAVAGSIGMLL